MRSFPRSLTSPFCSLLLTQCPPPPLLFSRPRLCTAGGVDTGRKQRVVESAHPPTLFPGQSPSCMWTLPKWYRYQRWPESGLKTSQIPNENKKLSTAGVSSKDDLVGLVPCQFRPPPSEAIFFCFIDPVSLTPWVCLLLSL